jgi:hypothetical protein
VADVRVPVRWPARVLRKDNHPCEGAWGGSPRRPGEGMDSPGGGGAAGPGEGPILVRALGGGPSGRVTAWVTPEAEALPSLGIGCPTLAIRVADCLLAWAPGKAPSL